MARCNKLVSLEVCTEQGALLKINQFFIVGILPAGNRDWQGKIIFKSDRQGCVYSVRSQRVRLFQAMLV
jgi:hypothetical protein